jgi:hypothetical protein
LKSKTTGAGIRISQAAASVIKSARPFTFLICLPCPFPGGLTKPAPQSGNIGQPAFPTRTTPAEWPNTLSNFPQPETNNHDNNTPPPSSFLYDATQGFRKMD